MRMKPPVRWVLVLFLAETAERKLAHGGVFSVIGQALDDGEAWSAVGACDEEILEAGVFGVAEFLEALVADGDVGGDD